MTKLEQARLGIAVPEIAAVAARERTSAEVLRQRLLDGRVVLPMNLCRKALGLPEIEPCGIGEGLRTKVNANIGTSQDFPDLKPELEKLNAAVEAGADTVMDLSTGGDIRSIRRRILEASRVPVGTVPIYDAAVRVLRQGRSVHAMTAAGILRAVRDHVEQGVDFITVHCGVTRDVLRTLEQSPRVCGIVSRGGTFLATWMARHGKENPLYEQFDEVLAIAREHDVTLSLGDGLRPGAQADAFDRAQVHELNVLAELAARAHEAGVQVMIEGPGHVPLHQIEAQVRMQKELCHGAPFYVLGPLVTDVAPGYDHITAAIGGAVAARGGRGLHLLRHADGAPRPAGGGARARGRHRRAHRRARRGHRQGRAGRRRVGPQVLRAPPRPRLAGANPHVHGPEAGGEFPQAPSPGRGGRVQHVRRAVRLQNPRRRRVPPESSLPRRARRARRTSNSRRGNG